MSSAITTVAEKLNQAIETATIFTFTVIRTPPQGFEGAPYCVAIINTGDTLETVRVAGYTDDREIAVGDTVHALARPDDNGATYTF